MIEDDDEEAEFAKEMAVLRRDLTPKPPIPVDLFQAALDGVSLRSVRKAALDAALMGHRSRSFMLAAFADALEADRKKSK